MMRILACALLASLTLVPADLAHNQAPSAGNADVNVMLNPAHIDNDRNSGLGGRTGVSGHYETMAGALDFAINSGSIVTLAPPISILCDREVLGDGTAPDPLLDETIVDSAAGGTVVPNGAWDDGGIGGACHETTYNYAPYNTPGCPSGALVNAEDAVTGPGVWIGAACDVTKSMASGTPEAEVLALCLAREAIQGADPSVLVGCAIKFISCTAPPGPLPACLITGAPICGTDGLVDVVNWGRGEGHGPAAVQFPAAGCSFSGAASVFVLSAVHVDTGGIGVVIAPATRGWIDQA